MPTAAVHYMVVAIVVGRLVMVIRIPVLMAVGGRCRIGNAGMFVMFALGLRKGGLRPKSRTRKEDRDQELHPPGRHSHVSIA